jgi:recombination protein RecT
MAKKGKESTALAKQPAQGGAISPRQEQFSSVGRMLKGNAEQLAAALPKHLTPDRMIRVTLSSLRKNPDLLDCDRGSLLAAIIASAQLGLEIDSGLGHAYIVPFKKEATLIVGYKGLLDLVWRTGIVERIWAREVYAEEPFSFEMGLHEDLSHTPSLEKDRGEIVAAYAVAVIKGGGRQFEVMTRHEIDAIMAKARGSSRSDSPWRTHYHMMARKTVIRRLCKMLPMSVEKPSQDLQRAIQIDEQADAGVRQTLDVEPGAFDPMAGLEPGEAEAAGELPEHSGTVPDDPFDLDEGDLGEGTAEDR